MNYFDCHIHVEEGLENYNNNIESINGNIIFNSIKSYEKFSSDYESFYHTLIFDLEKDIKFYEKLILQKKIRALKIHSRIQKIKKTDYPKIIQKLKELNLGIPIIYDAFYFGSNLKYQPYLRGLIELIKAFPERKFIIAHAGGYNILKYFFHLREFNNVGYDLSLSLQYLNDTSIIKDLEKLVKYTDFEKFFFGSDYPFGNPKVQINIFEEILNKNKFSNKIKNSILNDNWIKFTKF